MSVIMSVPTGETFGIVSVRHTNFMQIIPIKLSYPTPPPPIIEIIFPFFLKNSTQLCHASDDESILEILDNPSYGVLVDRSGWPVEKIITQKTKQEFFTQLLAEELITKCAK
jgi:hypothetical protein